MSLPTSITLSLIALTSVLLLLQNPICRAQYHVTRTDIDLIEVALNLEFLEAEFFLFGSQGYGLDTAAPALTRGGPPPLGARQARLNRFTRDIINQFGLQQIGHLRSIQNTVPGFPRPLIDLRADTIAAAMNKLLGRTLRPPFDPYANTVNYLLTSYVIPYISLTGYVGENPNLNSNTAKRLVAGLLSVKSGQDAIIRLLLFRQGYRQVRPYRITVAEVTDRISEFRNLLGGEGVKDEGLVVPQELGPEGLSMRNVIAGNGDSLAYGRSAKEVLRIVYGSGNESLAGGFFPNGANGRIARFYLQK